MVASRTNVDRVRYRAERYQKARPPRGGRAYLEWLATAYSPAISRSQYHRRCGA